MFVITKLRLMRNQFYNPIIRPVFHAGNVHLLILQGACGTIMPQENWRVSHKFTLPTIQIFWTPYI